MEYLSLIGGLLLLVVAGDLLVRGAVKIAEKFIGERGRINCSLRDPSGLWRWLGIQFVVSEK